jgi:energy-coupling factor transport system permease protein
MSAGPTLLIISRDSSLSRVYPLVKLAWVFLVAAFLFVFRSPVSGAVLFLLLLSLALIGGRVPLSRIARSGRFVAFLGVLLLVFHLASDPGVTVFTVGPIAVTEAGLRQGPVFFFRLTDVVLASFILIWTTDTRDLMASLAKAGMPYRFAYAVFLALRFLPLIQQEVDAVRDAHRIRGRASRTHLSHRVKLWGRYVFTVLINGLRKAETTSVSLETRAFGAYPTRSYMKEPRFRWHDILLLFVTAAVCAGLVVGERVL